MIEEKKLEENKQGIEKIKDTLFHPVSSSLTIKRLPMETFETFKQIANEQFVGDYGFTLKWLCDNLREQGMYAQIQDVLSDHEERIHRLESPSSKPSKFKTHRTVSGREIKLPVKE